MTVFRGRYSGGIRSPAAMRILLTIDGKIEKSLFTRMPIPQSFPGAIWVWTLCWECTGFFCSKAKSQAHIDAGAKRVLISAPCGQ